MKKILTTLLVLALALPASAGPIARAAEQVAKEAAQAPPKTTAKNRYLLPSLALIGGGTTVALIGFLHTTRHSIDPVFLTPAVLAANPYLADQLMLVTGYATHNTALGVAGIGVAGAGAVLLAVGHHRKGAKDPKLSVGPGTAAAHWSFTF